MGGPTEALSVIRVTSHARRRAAAWPSPQPKPPLIEYIGVTSLHTDRATDACAEAATTFDCAVGTAAQEQSARLREFFPQLSRLEDDIYRGLLERLAY